MKYPHKKQIKLTVISFISIVLLTGVSILAYDVGSTLYSQIELFSDILQKIELNYVDEKNPQELMQNAIRGMISALDPHTTYLTSEQFDQWSKQYEGYTGIGITYDVIRERITVMSVFSGGPSDKAGILIGDRIISIDGKSAVGIGREEAPLLLMGPKGTKVNLTIERKGLTDTKDIAVIRDEVHLNSIPYIFIIQPGVGYIRINRFTETTGEELEKGLDKLEAQGMKQLILDLRGNGGGYLEAAVQVVDKFLPGGRRIVYTKGRTQGSSHEFFSTNQNTHPLYPLIVIIDRISASASEIVAGALQDWDRALIIGETSFGKGLVQTQYLLKDGSSLLMTTARYYTPSNRLIQRPYDNISLEDYYREVTDDVARKEWENDPSRPIVKTQILKRNVYGGGGITPDIFLRSKPDTISIVVRNILSSPEKCFFTFIEDYMKDHSELVGKDYNQFLKNYTPNGNTLQMFLNHIRELGFQITNEEFVSNKKDIEFVLKQYIASKIWGDEASYKVQVMRDYQLLETLNHLSQSEDLLAQSYSRYRDY